MSMETDSEQAPPQEERSVVIQGVSIPFLDLVVLLVKLALAMIPAAIIASIAYFLIVSVVSGLLLAPLWQSSSSAPATRLGSGRAPRTTISVERQSCMSDCSIIKDDSERRRCRGKCPRK